MGTTRDIELGATELRLVNDLAGMATIAGWVEHFGAEQHLSPAVIGNLKTVFDEAVSNLIAYGYAEGDHGEIVLRLRRWSNEVEVEIEDDGAPFDPLHLPPPNHPPPLAQRQAGGLGVDVYRNLMDQMSYQRVRGHNVFKLIRNMIGDR